MLFITPCIIETTLYMILLLLIRIILIILIVHYDTSLFDTLSCEEISPDEQGAFPESEPQPTTKQIIMYMTIGALIATSIMILLAAFP